MQSTRQKFLHFVNPLEIDNFVECGRTIWASSATRDVASLLARVANARGMKLAFTGLPEIRTSFCS